MAATTRTEALAAALLNGASAYPPPAADDDGDERFLARKAAVSALTHARLKTLHARLAVLAPALERRLRDGQASAVPGDEEAATPGGGDVAWTDEPALTPAQMLDKLAFVAETAASELSAPEGDDAADWSALLAVVMGGADAEPLGLGERDEAARRLDDALDARLALVAPAAAAATTAEEEEEAAAAVADAVASHLRAALSAESEHSLRRLLRQFRGAFSTLYEPFASLPPERHTDAETADTWSLRVACALALAAADVFRLAGLLAQVLRAKHAELRSASARSTALLRRLAVDALFDKLQRALHELLTAAFRREDTFLGDVAYLARASPPAAFGVREALRLDGSWDFGDHEDAADSTGGADADPDAALDTEARALERRQRRAALSAHAGALFWLESMSTSSRAPSDKLRRLTRACREARGAGALYYVAQWGSRCRRRGWDVVSERDGEALPTPEALELSPRDLHALLGFLLSAAPSTNAHIFSQLAVLSVFRPLLAPADSEQRDAVAALVGAVQLLMPSSA